MRKILVIDDETSIRKAFRLGLDEDLCEIDEATSGSEGINKAKSKQYDVICCDLNMPGMNGAEAMEELHKLNPNAKLYVITAFYNEYEKMLETAKSHGVTFELIRKPIGIDAIKKIAM